LKSIYFLIIGNSTAFKNHEVDNNEIASSIYVIWLVM